MEVSCISNTVMPEIKSVSVLLTGQRGSGKTTICNLLKIDEPDSKTTLGDKTTKKDKIMATKIGDCVYYIYDTVGMKEPEFERDLEEKLNRNHINCILCVARFPVRRDQEEFIVGARGILRKYEDSCLVLTNKRSLNTVCEEFKLPIDRTVTCQNLSPTEINGENPGLLDQLELNRENIVGLINRSCTEDRIKYIRTGGHRIIIFG